MIFAGLYNTNILKLQLSISQIHLYKKIRTNMFM